MWPLKTVSHVKRCISKVNGYITLLLTPSLCPGDSSTNMLLGLGQELPCALSLVPGLNWTHACSGHASSQHLLRWCIAAEHHHSIVSRKMAQAWINRSKSRFSLITGQKVPWCSLETNHLCQELICSALLCSGLTNMLKHLKRVHTDFVKRVILKQRWKVKILIPPSYPSSPPGF